MSKPRHIVFVLMALAMAAACALHIYPEREPRYQGKSLSKWLDEPRHDDDSGKRVERAVRAMGKKAIPVLLEKLQTQDSPLKLKLMDLVKRQSLVTVHFTQAVEDRRRAIAGFRVLGPEAKATLPELARLFHNRDTALDGALAMAAIGRESVALFREGLTNEYWWTREASARALSEAGSNAWVAVPDLVACLRNEQDGNYDLRCYAAESLGEIGQQPDLVIPALTKSLDDPFKSVCQSAAEALGKFGQQATSAVPALLKVLYEARHGTMFYQEAVTNALRAIAPSIDPEAAVQEYGR